MIPREETFRKKVENNMKNFLNFFSIIFLISSLALAKGDLAHTSKKIRTKTWFGN